MRPVGVVGAAALSRHGTGWRGLGATIRNADPLPGMLEEAPLANPRARKMMSRGAYLAASCLHDLMADVGWDPDTRAGAGYYLGVGASGGSLADVTALLAASLVDVAGERTFSPRAFGEHGLAACNPLLAFQLMNNFTLCHGAILDGIGGPNSALFSRGTGTVSALIEAVHAIREGECTHALAGGADSATHPVTLAELAREGLLARGLVPAEGAGLVALAATTQAHATIDGAAIASGTPGTVGQALDEAVARAVTGTCEVDLVVTAAWGPPAADALATWIRARHPKAIVVEATPALGESLAASPALAWIAAVDLLAARRAGRALVISAGPDGDVGVVVLSGGAP